MIIALLLAPKGALQGEIYENMQKHLPAHDEHGIILLPLLPSAMPPTVHKGILQTDTYQIALDYQTHDATPEATALLTSNILRSIKHLPGSLRVPYILFIYSDTFRKDNRDALEYGPSAYTLIRQLANGKI